MPDELKKLSLLGLIAEAAQDVLPSAQRASLLEVIT